MNTPTPNELHPLISAQSERLMREVREFLGYAREVFPVNRELADAFGARAANKLARVVGAQS